jgi:hypothetical protein
MNGAGLGRIAIRHGPAAVADENCNETRDRCGLWRCGGSAGRRTQREGLVKA